MTSYVVEYCFCAIAFLFVVLWTCFTTRQFPGLSYKLFRLDMVCALIYVVSDAVGAYTIPLATTLPAFINYAVNMVYYFLQVLIPAVLFMLVLVLSGLERKQIPAHTLLPFILSELIVLTDPIHRLLFNVDPVAGYSLGPLFNVVFGCNMLYVVLSLVSINRYKKRLSKKQYSSITLFAIIVVIAAIAQYFNPEILLSSPAIAISVTLLYLTMQKPEDMLDVTSGVFNRTAMMRMVDIYISNKREFKATLIVLKNVSRLDRIMGYESLNRLMSEIGEFLSNSLGRSLAFRLSGSTLFVVLTEGDDDEAADKIKNRFGQGWLKDEYNIVLPVSILRLTNTAMLTSADEFALLINYIAEDTDEQVDLSFGEEAYKAVKRHQYIENALQTALDKDLFEIYLQPIYSLKDDSFTHAEALLRLNWEGNMISPAEFIPVAEQNGLVLKIDNLVFKKVCAFIKSLSECESRLIRCVGVNMSALEFMRPDLMASILQAVKEYGVDPSIISIEMTETAASGSMAETCERMGLLKSYGFGLTLDDFGTGFANITQVVHLPFDIAKLDHSILSSGVKDDRGLYVLRHSIGMFREMNMEIIAEGAESEQEVELLKQLGVDYIQGFYYARPMPVGAFKEFLRKKGNNVTCRSSQVSPAPYCGTSGRFSP